MKKITKIVSKYLTLWYYNNNKDSIKIVDFKYPFMPSLFFVYNINGSHLLKTLKCTNRNEFDFFSIKIADRKAADIILQRIEHE